MQCRLYAEWLWSMFEPAISITHADGNISTELLFQSVQEQKKVIMFR
jgi:hypothetical protein